MTDKIADRIAGSIGRRGFIARLSAAASALVLSLFGYTRAGSSLVTVACCTLCKDPNTCTYNCACEWAWTCRWEITIFPNQKRCRIYRCAECYADVSSGCSGSCFGAVCSKAIDLMPCTVPPL